MFGTNQPGPGHLIVEGSGQLVVAGLGVHHLEAHAGRRPGPRHGEWTGLHRRRRRDDDAAADRRCPGGHPGVPGQRRLLRRLPRWPSVRRPGQRRTDHQDRRVRRDRDRCRLLQQRRSRRRQVRHPVLPRRHHAVGGGLQWRHVVDREVQDASPGQPERRLRPGDSALSRSRQHLVHGARDRHQRSGRVAPGAGAEPVRQAKERRRRGGRSSSRR